MNFTTILSCLELAAQIYNGTQINSDYVLINSYKNDLYKPYFFIAKNRNDDYSIVIRGENSFEDIETLIDYMPVNISSEFMPHKQASEFLNYLASSSILKAATYVVNQVQDIICNAAGKIYFTGHSYGASVAAIAATLVRLNHSACLINNTENRYYLRTYSVSFGSYPCLSPALSRITRKFVANFIVNNDVFASLNPKNVDKILDSIVQKGTSQAKAGAARITLLLAKIVQYFNDEKVKNSTHGSEKKEVDLTKVSLEMTLKLIETASKAASIQMVNPGIVYHVTTSNPGTSVPKKKKALDFLTGFFKGKPKSESIIDYINGIEIGEFDENAEYGNLLDFLGGFADHYIWSYLKVIKQSENTKYPYYY